MSKEEFVALLIAYGSTMFSRGALSTSDTESELLDRTCEGLKEELINAFEHRT